MALCPPTQPAAMRCQAAPAVLGRGTIQSSAKLPLAPPPWAVAEPAWGTSKLLTAFYFFFKHMLVYENNHPGTFQAYTDKSTLRHEGLPKEWGKASTHPLSRSSTATGGVGGQPSRAPSTMGHPDVARTPAAGAESGFRGYLAVILIHISAFGGKNKRFLPNQQANLTQKGRAPPCSPWLQHPLPVLPARQTSSPGTARVTSVGRAHPLPVKPSRCPVLCWGVLGSAPCCGCPLCPPPRFPGAVGTPTRAGGPRQGRDSEGSHGGTRGGSGKGLAWAVRSEEQGERRFCTS